MPRYIDADALIKDAVKESNQDGAYGYMDAKDIVDLINDAPTADVVEIVRCKDCEYFDQAEKYCCDFLTAEEDGFCKWGKRRT